MRADRYPVTTPVEIPLDSFLRWAVTITNNSGRDIDLGSEHVFLRVYIADELSEESGNPQTDLDTWLNDCMYYDGYYWEKYFLPGDVLKAGASKTVTHTEYVLSIGLVLDSVYDVGCVVGYTPDYKKRIAYDSMKIDEAIKIVEPIRLRK